MRFAAPVEGGHELMPGERQGPHQRRRLGIRCIVGEGTVQQRLDFGVIGRIAHLADLLEVGPGQQVNRLPIIRMSLEFCLRLGNDIVGPHADRVVSSTRDR